MPAETGEAAGEQSDASGYTTTARGYWQFMWEGEKAGMTWVGGKGGNWEQGQENHMSYSQGGRGITYDCTKIYENVFTIFVLMLRI